MIKAESVTFAYEKKRVLQDISFTETEPAIVGLWGRNGAGKSTLMNLLGGHYKPDLGDIEIMGFPPYNNAQAARHLCYMQEEHPFSINWTAEDALRFGRYFNSNWNQAEADYLVDVFRLDLKMNVRKLSKGMKSAVQFIIGLASCADVTILDEPINGMDAGMRKKTYEAIRKSHEENPRHILLSTHHIEEVQPICESLLVLHKGMCLLHKPLDEIREKGVWISGSKERVEIFCTGQKMLERSEAGPVIKVMIDIPFSKKWKDAAVAEGLSAEKAKLQDYLLNITEPEGVSV